MYSTPAERLCAAVPELPFAQRQQQATELEQELRARKPRQRKGKFSGAYRRNFKKPMPELAGAIQFQPPALERDAALRSQKVQLERQLAVIQQELDEINSELERAS